MATSNISGDSSPLSSIPDSEGLSLPSLSQPTPKKPTEPPIEDIELPNDPPQTPVMPSARPKRTRAAPTAKKEPPKKVAKRVPKKKTWDAENVLTDPKSPLATADLRKLLLDPMTWDVLTPADKQEILTLLPPGSQIAASDPAEQAVPDFAHLRNDDSFRYDCASYVENIRLGRFEEEWLECAWAAHQRRKMGDYDEFLEKRFEEQWETELPEELKVKRAVKVKGAGEAEVSNGKKDGDEVGGEEEGPEDANHKQDIATRENDNIEKDSLPGPTHHDGEPQSTANYEDKPQPTAAKAHSGSDDGYESANKSQDDDNRMVIDELQEESPQKKPQTPLVRRPNFKMEVDGEDSADELA